MPFNGSGTFYRIHNFEADRAALIPVTSVRVDAEFNGIAQALSNCLTRDGQSAPSGPITFPSGGHFSDGSYLAPSITFINDLDLGIYRDGSNNLGIGSGGARLANFHPDDVVLRSTKLSVLKNLNGGLVFSLKNADLTSPSVVAKIDLQAGETTGLVQLNHDDGTGLVGVMYAGTTSDSPFKLYANGGVGTPVGNGIEIWKDHNVSRAPIWALGVSPPDPLLPVYTFFGDSTTGMYRPAGQTIGFAINGVLQYSWATAGFVSTPPIKAGVGAVATPPLTFNADPDTGFFRSATGTVQVIGDGAVLATFAPAAITLAKPLTLTGALTMTGDLTLNGALKTTLLAQFGTQAAPGISFESDPNTGFWHPVTADTLNIVCGGVSPVSFSTSTFNVAVQTRVMDGSESIPAYSFSNDTDTGFFSQPADGSIGITNNGVTTATFAATYTAFAMPTLHADGTMSLPGISFIGHSSTGLYRVPAEDHTLYTSVSGLWMMRIDAGAGIENVATRYPILASAGFASTPTRPAFALGSDPNTGLYGSATDVLAVSAGGVGVAFFGQSSVVIGPVLAVSGPAVPSITTPQYTFYTDENTGIYHPADDTVNIVCGGVVKAALAPSGAYIVYQSGSAALPSIAFDADGFKNTGIYWPGEDAVGVTCGGVNALSITTGGVFFPGKINVGPNATPQNGDLWFDGTDFKCRIGGVIKTFTVT